MKTIVILRNDYVKNDGTAAINIFVHLGGRMCHDRIFASDISAKHKSFMERNAPFSFIDFYRRPALKRVSHSPRYPLFIRPFLR